MTAAVLPDALPDALPESLPEALPDAPPGALPRTPRDRLPVCLPTALPLARRLGRDQFLHFKRPRRLCVRAERGTLWITVDGEQADIELQAGASRVFDSGAPVFVGVLGGSAVLTARQLPAPGWRERWRAMLRRTPLAARA